MLVTVAALTVAMLAASAAPASAGPVFTCCEGGSIISVRVEAPYFVNLVIYEGEGGTLTLDNPHFCDTDCFEEQ